MAGKPQGKIVLHSGGKCDVEAPPGHSVLSTLLLMAGAVAYQLRCEACAAQLPTGFIPSDVKGFGIGFSVYKDGSIFLRGCNWAPDATPGEALSAWQHCLAAQDENNLAGPLILDS